MFRKLFISLVMMCSPLIAISQGQNAIIVCENSTETLAWDLDFISKAKYCIEFSPTFTGGTVFRACMEAFEKRMKQVPQLQIYFLLSPALLDPPDWRVIERMQKEYAANFHVQFTDSIFVAFPDYLTFDNHVKCLVVDEHYFSVGGTNFDEFQCVEGTTAPKERRVGETTVRNNIPGGMRDQDVVGRGPIAKQIREEFHKLFALWEYYNKTYTVDFEPDHFKENYRFQLPADKPSLERFEKSSALRTASKVTLLMSIPFADNPIKNEYVNLINNANNTISIANLYLQPDDAISEAIMGAAQRGIEMQILTNGYWEGSPSFGALIGWSNRLSYVPYFYGRTFHFWQKGLVADTKLRKTRIFEYQVGDTFLHKKLMVVDRKYTMIGSYNLGKRSDRGDYEMNLLIESEEVAKDVLKVLDRDKSFSTEVKPNDAVMWYFDPAISYMASLQTLLHVFL